MAKKNRGGIADGKRGRPFEPGNPGGPGRPPGVPNKATTEIKAFFRGVLESDEYRESLKARLLAGEVAPALEALAYHYAYGKPVERVEMTGKDGEPLEHKHELDIGGRIEQYTESFRAVSRRSGDQGALPGHGAGKQVDTA